MDKEGKMGKLAVFFPGIGYTTDKPLLHYSRRMASDLGYEIMLLSYGGFPADIFGDEDKMVECYRIALAQATQGLSGVIWDSYEDILFVGKSVGTGIAAWIASRNPARSRIRLILYTPLEEMFSLPVERAVVFTGTDDPWVDRDSEWIPAICERKSLPCIVIQGGNHSLETADVETDIRNLQMIMEETKRFILWGA